jgi:hypothetical protein
LQLMQNVDPFMHAYIHTYIHNAYIHTCRET